MKGDRISINGKIVPFGDSGLTPEELLSSNFIYQKIHTLGYRTLQSEWAAEIADMSCKALYDCPAGFTRESLAKEVEALLAANRYPPASTLVTLYLIPGYGDGPPARLLSCEKQLVYKGYAVATGISCVAVPYEYPFWPHKTAISLAAHTYAAGYARRQGFDGAIAENAAGVMTGFGENPLYAVAGHKVLTPSIDCGAADSVERRLGIMACEDAGLTVCEHSVSSTEAAGFDEIFSVTPQGITSIQQLGDRLFPHSFAKNLLPYLKRYQ